MPDTLFITDIYKDYKKEGGKLPQDTFKALCEEFNVRVMEDIVLQGGVFNQGFYLSEISVLKIPRNFKNRHIDWKESNKLKKELLDQGKELYDSETGEGEKWLVYYTDPWFCRFYWSKYTSSVPNRSKYRFVPTRGKVGNKTKLKKLLNGSTTAHLRFRKAEDVNMNNS